MIRSKDRSSYHDGTNLVERLEEDVHIGCTSVAIIALVAFLLTRWLW